MISFKWLEISLCRNSFKIGPDLLIVLLDRLLSTVKELKN